MHPLDWVLQYYPVPFVPRKDQYEDVARLITWQRSGTFLPIGAGKTFTSTMVALHAALSGSVQQIIVIAPPILLSQWAQWLRSFEGIGSVVVYRGLPSVRANLDLNADCVLMTSGVLKNDYQKLIDFYRDRKVFVIVDEATVVRNIDTLTHKAFRDFVRLPSKFFTLLTGTTISAPHQAYGYINLITPGVYRDYTQFLAIHVTGVDQFKEPCRFARLDLLAENLVLQAVRREADDILDLPEVTYVPVQYELTAAHKRLYDKVIEELLVVLDDGVVLDGLTPGRLRATAQRVIMMPSEFGGASINPTGFGLIDAMTDELDGEKFIIYANYHTSCEAIYAYCQQLKLNPVIVYGGALSSSAKNQVSLSKFIDSKDCRVLVGHPLSCGVGVDNLQHVCRAALFLELPTPSLFSQAVGRLKRTGQKKNCVIKIATALGTVQVGMQKRALEKEDLVQQVAYTKDSLRRALRGEEG